MPSFPDPNPPAVYSASSAVRSHSSGPQPAVCRCQDHPRLVDRTVQMQQDHCLRSPPITAKLAWISQGLVEGQLTLAVLKIHLLSRMQVLPVESWAWPWE